MAFLACSVAWIVTAVVAIEGLRATGSPWCIWVMLLPALVNWGRGKSNREEDEKKDEQPT